MGPMQCQQPSRAHKDRGPCPSLQSLPRRTVRASAGRRDGNHRRARQRPSPNAPSQPRKPTPTPVAPPVPQQPQLERVEVPSLGWMWQSSSGGSGAKDGAGASSVAAPRPMPSASATVANLYEDRIKAKKSLGQNFLTDDSILQDIVAAAGVGPGDLVLEVGPGTGNLTKHLLARGARVTAVEKDDTLYGRLTEEYGEVPELQLVHGDALKVGLEDIIRGMVEQDRPPPPAVHSDGVRSDAAATAATTTPEPSATSTSASATREAINRGSEAGSHAKPKRGVGIGGGGGSGGPGRAARKVKVVANLPYNITKDLLVLLLPLGDVISDLHIMIQHEAAVRLTERTPGGPEWRAANIRTLFYCKPRYRFRIPRHKYDPVPGVDGALVTFSLLPPGSRPRVASERAFHALVNKAFSERRKKMRNSVQPLFSSEQVEAALAACSLNVDSRAQDLTLEQFVAVSWRLHELQAEAGRALLQQQQQQQQQHRFLEAADSETERQGRA